MNNTCCWRDEFIVGFLAVWWDLLTIRRKTEYLPPHRLKVAIQKTLITRVWAIKSFCFIGWTYCSPFPGWSTWTPRSVSPAANTKRGDAVIAHHLFWPEAGNSAMWWPLMAAKVYSFNEVVDPLLPGSAEGDRLHPPSVEDGERRRRRRRSVWDNTMWRENLAMKTETMVSHL